MKNAFLLFLLLPFCLNGQVPGSPAGDIYAQVSGNSVFLGQSMALRNCGAAYDMQVILLGDTLFWYQVDTGATAVCLCNFNFSVTVDSIPAGHYTAKVFYTGCPDCPPPGADTGYVGSVEFDITEQIPNSSIHLTDENQSDCFPYNGIEDDNDRDLPCSVFPNPVQNMLHLVTADPGKKEVRIFDMQNRSLFEGEFEANAADVDMANYNSGVYFLVYANKSATYHLKIIKK